MTIYDRIREFTSVAPVPVSWSFGPSCGYGYEIVRKAEPEVIYKTRTVRRGDDGLIGPVGGFLLGSML